MVIILQKQLPSYQILNLTLKDLHCVAILTPFMKNRSPPPQSEMFMPHKLHKHPHSASGKGTDVMTQRQSC